MDDKHDQDAVGKLEEELRRESAAVEQEQLEHEISGNLTPEDEEMIDLREERLWREANENALKPGDRVRKRDGTTATVATAPMYYEKSKGDPVTGWAVIIEPDGVPEMLLDRAERDLGPYREYALLESLALKADRPA